MREDLLDNEDLARALAEYLKRERLKRQTFIDENKKNLYYDNLSFNKEITNLDKLYSYKINKDSQIFDEANDFITIPQIQREINRELYGGPTPIEQETARARFLQDNTQVLSIDSSSFLKEDTFVILTSIKRDINSIAYATNLTDEVKQTAILEAKKQGYVFRADTPLFMLYDSELIRGSLNKDVNSIIFLPRDAITDELIAYARDTALKNGYTLSNNSPRFLRTDIEIIKQTLRLDKNSAIHINWDSLNADELNDIERYIIENHLDYIINVQSPINFKRNADICIISAKNDPDSVSYFDWKYLHENEEEGKRVVDALVEQNYVLNNTSPDILRGTPRLCLNSVKNDINSARYFSKELQNLLTYDFENPLIKDTINDKFRKTIYELRHYLLENDFYSLEETSKFDLLLLKDDFILDYYLKQLGAHQDIEDEKDKIFYSRVKTFVKDILSTSLSVANTRKVFKMVAEKKWEEYRRENNDYYTNIFNRICDSLEKNNNFISAINELKFLMKIDDVLDERKYALFNAFIEYHQLYHRTNADNKMELLQAKRDDISKNAALFISKSKEDYIKEQMAQFDEQYKRFFTIRTDNPIVRKKVIEIKQRDMLKKLFNSQDTNLMQKLDVIKNKYLGYNYNHSINQDIIPSILDLFISKSINSNVSSIDDVILSQKPIRFDEYENYEKVSKLLNRLNSHNISFDGDEVRKYRDFIIFDGEKYVYNGSGFSEEEITQIMGYKDLKYVFGKIRSEIIQIAKSIDKFDKITDEDIKTVIGECPFTDEYYEFDSSIYNRYFLLFIDDYVNVFTENKDVILDDKKYALLQQLAYSDGLVHVAAITAVGFHDTKDSKFAEIDKYVSDEEVASVLANIPNLMNMLAPNEINIDNLDKVLDFKEMFKYADLKQISLLGKDVIKKIYSNNSYTSNSQAERINVACDLLSAMTARNTATVPYINGSYHNYRYSMYDSTDATLLTAGLDTNACFRCCGNDNDFLHYCALDKNGFVIKLTDTEGNFIGRASGFRNGNGVYINQLRTIYDKKSSAYGSEREAIIKTFEQACNDIVETSQKNPNEENKIDFVVVTQSYTLADVKRNVSEDTRQEIGNAPMDGTSEDWKNFIKNTNNLREAKSSGYYFTTDFGNYSLICIKSAVGELTPDKIKKGDVPALYMRTRKQISAEKSNENTEIAVNRIRAMYSHQTGEKFNYLKLPEGSRIANGDNWYILFGEEGIIDSCYLASDPFAAKEFNAVMEELLTQKQISEEISASTPKR